MNCLNCGRELSTAGCPVCNMKPKLYGNYKDAKGCIPWPPGESPEQIMRRMRSEGEKKTCPDCKSNQIVNRCMVCGCQFEEGYK